MNDSFHNFKILFCILFLFLINPIFAATSPNNLSKKDIILIHNHEIPKSEKKALIILPGFGNKNKRRKKQRTFFSQLDYDLYIPDFHDKKSFEATVEKFARFFDKHELSAYKKVHVFSYILGTWIINSYIIKHGTGNIRTIISDRSPLQERAPQIVVNH